MRSVRSLAAVQVGPTAVAVTVPVEVAAFVIVVVEAEVIVDLTVLTLVTVTVFVDEMTFVEEQAAADRFALELLELGTALDEDDRETALLLEDEAGRVLTYVVTVEVPLTTTVSETVGVL